MWSRWILTKAYDLAFWISHHAVLVEAAVAALVVDDVSLFVQPGDVVSVEVDDSSIFQNSVPCGSVLVPDNIDLFFLSFSCGFRFQFSSDPLKMCQAMKVIYTLTSQ